MSLLMEALRKAEEAKIKAEQQDINSESEDSVQANTSNAEIKQNSSIPEKIDFATSPKVEVEQKDSSIELEYFSESKTNTASNEFDEPIEPEGQSQYSPNDSSSILSTEVEAPDFNEIENDSNHFEDDIVLDFDNPTEEIIDALPGSVYQGNKLQEEDESKHAINALFQAKVATRKQQQQRKYGITAIALLLIIGFAAGGYWYFIPSSDFQYPIPSTDLTANRGFLGETGTALEADLTSELESEPGSEQSQESNRDNDTVMLEENLLAQESSNIPGDSPSTTALATNGSDPAENTLSNSEELINNDPKAERDQISFIRTDNKTSLNPQVSSAYINFQNGNFDVAFNQYQDALNSNINDRNALLGLASIYLKRGNNTSAQGLYSRLLKLNPQDPLARAGLLETSRSDNPTQQEQELRSLVGNYPDIAPLSFALGNLYASQNRWNEAQSAYFDAALSAKLSGSAQISPDYSFNLAVSLERLQQPLQAYNFYLEALELSRYSVSGFDLNLLTQRIEYLERSQL